MQKNNYYYLLRLKENAMPEDIKSAFKKKILRAGDRSILPLKEAFDNLINPDLRSKHDQELGKMQSDGFSVWRDYYKTYSEADIKADQEFGEKALQQALTRLESSAKNMWLVRKVLLWLIIITIVTLIIIFFNDLKHLLLNYYWKIYGIIERTF